MGLFDEENPPVEEDQVFDDKEKIRLFQTHNASGKSVKHYLKVILPIVIGVAVIVGLVVYFMLPARGDVVRAPHEMADAIEAYYADTERRSVADVTAYYCEDHYAAMVQLEPNPYIPGKPRDPNLPRHVLALNKENSGWEIRASNATNPDDPCAQ
jgi:hypothetical protein